MKGIIWNKEEGRVRVREIYIGLVFLFVVRISATWCTDAYIYQHPELIHDPTNTRYLILAQNIFPYRIRSHNKLQSLVNRSLILVMEKGGFVGKTANIIQIS